MAEISRSGGSSRRSWSSRLSGSFKDLMADPSDVFHARGRSGAEDEAALREIAIDKLTGSKRKEVFIDEGIHVLEENEQLLRGIRDRMDSAGIEMPKIEVRFEGFSVEADAYVGRRALPTLINSTVNALEGIVGRLGLPVASKKTVNNILSDVSGVLKPSRMTLLLGPPGSGKSTLLLALAGKLDNSLRVKGKITYNGRELKEFVPQRTSAYVSQDDLHQGEMTVRETLEFSRTCLGVGSGDVTLREIAAKEEQVGIRPDPDIDRFMKETMTREAGPGPLTAHILKMLGLDVCADVMVGDELRRGISGGQKKRTTVGEMLVGPARVLLLDEISNGLDTSTTFQIMKFLQQTVHALDSTMLISLLQPQPETFELFDDVILLSEGKIVYQGPRDRVLEFFEFMGFKCPERKGIPDFLQEVTSKSDQEQYWSDRKRPYQFTSVEDFIQGSGSFFGAINGGLEDTREARSSGLAVERYGIPRWGLFKACFEREWLLMKRNSLLYIAKTFQLIFLAGLGTSVFPRTEMKHETIADGGKYLGALFYGLICVMFNGMAEIVLTIVRLPVHYKQRDLLFYPAWSFGLPFVLTKLPISVIESVIWVAITYYGTGFAPSSGRFFRQILAYFWTHQVANALFRFIGAAARSLVAANSAGVLGLVLVFALSGFVISKDDLDPWWIWGYWISPMMYGQNALAINEFLDPRWNKPNTDPNINAPTIGTALLESRGIYVDGYWYWISVGALAGLTFIYNAGFVLCTTYLSAIQESRAIMADNGEKSKLKVAAANGNSKKGISLPFQPLSLAFSHVNYYVDMPAEMKAQGRSETRLQLLSDVSGAFRPGVLTALVGVSGAGKTTLMDVLAGRKTGGYIEGSVSISGYPKNQATFARISGYCEQNDIHSPNVTVYESLIYSAWLRLPSDVKPETQKAFVEEVMELIELDKLRDALVGLPGVNGLSTEQRKRFTVAVELVANPSIIFMDEPTSGLDARSAAIVMRTVRNTVNTGRTVVCTIHQPSIDIFESFDELLLMKLGGQVIYAGQLGRNSRNLVDYFQAIPGIPKIKEGQNPATWMLQITAPSVEAQLNLDFADVYQKSKLYQSNMKMIEELSSPAPGSEDLFFGERYARSYATQLGACFWKQHRSYWKNPSYNSVRFLSTIVMALFFGTLFWNKGQQTNTQQDVLNLMGAVYCFSFFLGLTIGSTVQPVVAVERTVFYRERAAGMYSALAYALAQVGIEVIYIAAQAVVYCLICYPMMGFEWRADKFFWFIFLVFTCFLYFVTHGMMSIALTPAYPIGSIVMLLFFNFWNVFCGFLIYRPMLPKWWRWCYWTSPVAWTIYGLIVSQFGESDQIIQVPGRPDMTLRAFLKEVPGYEYGFLGYVAAAHVGFVILFAIGFAMGIKFLNFQRR